MSLTIDWFLLQDVFSDELTGFLSMLTWKNDNFRFLKNSFKLKFIIYGILDFGCVNVSLVACDGNDLILWLSHSDQ